MAIELDMIRENNAGAGEDEIIKLHTFRTAKNLSLELKKTHEEREKAAADEKKVSRK
jgi:hypothetical protein